MSTVEHYREAERLLASLSAPERELSDASTLAEAQVRATMALAGAVALAALASQGATHTFKALAALAEEAAKS